MQPPTAPIRALTYLNTDKPEKASVDRGLAAWGQLPGHEALRVHLLIRIFVVLRKMSRKAAFLSLAS